MFNVPLRSSMSYSQRIVYRIEHSKLEFTLTIKVRRDPHIAAQFKAATWSPPQPPIAHQPPPASKGGLRSFFQGGNSKRLSKPAVLPAEPAKPLPENLARYLKPDCTLARAFIAFKDIARLCDTKLFETSYPLIGQKFDRGPTTKTLQVGEVVFQIFRLPPLPGIPSEQLPQSLEECHRGLRHVQWHKVTYFEGTLTQNGGGCTVSCSPTLVSSCQSFTFFFLCRHGVDDISVSLART